MKRILVLCTGNSCRSQMAEGYLRKFAAGRAEVFSAGVEAHGMNPYAMTVMKEGGVDISSQYSKTMDEFLGQKFDFILTVCDNAKERCPVFPGQAIRIHKNFPDPAGARGTEPEILKVYSEVRDMIREFSENFCKENL